VALILGALVLLVLLVPAARIALYRQVDDDEHVKLKHDYLERVARLAADRPAGPNVVLILFDDLGFGDLGVYGGTAVRTPNLDRLAAEGAMFTNAYAAAPYCSASRAGLLTGRYALRSGLDHVLQPAGSREDLLIRMGWLNTRLPGEEITLAEVLSAAGYATAIFGKWHLGAKSPSLPNDLGFDAFYGLLYSNDQGKPAVYDNETVAERHPIDQATLTRRYTERAVSFIETHADEPFFLYLPHTFPHIPLHVSPERLGHSDGGLYGDVVEELDESVGAVLDALEQSGVAANTLVVVSSDNGPWFQGSPGGLRGRKMNVFEGGMRVPLLARWPGGVPAGHVIDETVVGVDLFPTILALARLPLPEDRVIDGESLAGLLRGQNWERRHPVYFHRISTLEALREGRFKYHDRHGVFFGNPMDWAWGPMRKRGPWLFDLELDPDESYDVSATYPDVATRLGAALERRRQELADNPRGWR
jgi:arylsulfatase A-like enzyme